MSFKKDFTEYAEVFPTSTTWHMMSCAMEKLNLYMTEVITLPETEKTNNITFNAKKFFFKPTDCKFFGGNLTSVQ